MFRQNTAINYDCLSTICKVSLIKGEVLKKCLQTIEQICLYLFFSMFFFICHWYLISCYKQRANKEHVNSTGLKLSLQTQQFSLLEWSRWCMCMKQGTKPSPANYCIQWCFSRLGSWWNGLYMDRGCLKIK